MWCEAAQSRLCWSYAPQPADSQPWIVSPVCTANTWFVHWVYYLVILCAVFIYRAAGPFSFEGNEKGAAPAWPYMHWNLRSFLNNPLNMPRRCTTWHAALWRRVGPMCLTTCVCHHDTSSDADWMEPSLCLQPWQPWLTSFIILHAGADSSIWLTVGREDWWGGWLTNDAVKTLSGHDLKVWCSLSDKQGIHKHMLVSL